MPNFPPPSGQPARWGAPLLLPFFFMVIFVSQYSESDIDIYYRVVGLGLPVVDS